MTFAGSPWWGLASRTRMWQLEIGNVRGKVAISI
jgi:hypothetical protein